MKTYRITVNGNVYDVAVEETTGQEILPPVQPIQQQPINLQSKEVFCPIYGIIKNINVSQGQIISEGQPIVEIESDNTINIIGAPFSGQISINTNVGETVEAGSILFYIG